MPLEGRQVDLAIFANPNASGSVPLELDFANPPMLIAGPLKAAHQWMMLFLTRRGSVAGDVEYGSSFMGQAISGRLNDNVAVLQAFAQAILEVSEYLNNRLTGDEPDDEVITSAVLMDGWGFDGVTRLTLPVRLTTRNGSQRVILAAVPMIAN